MLRRDGYGDLQIYNMQMLNWLVSMNVFAFTAFCSSVSERTMSNSQGWVVRGATLHKVISGNQNKLFKESTQMS